MINKRLKTITLLLLAVLFSYSQAFCAEADISKLIFKDASFIFKMNIGSLISQSQAINSQIPSLKKAQEEIQAEIEKRTGMVINRDIKQLIISAGPAANFSDKIPGDILIAITGSFNAEKLTAEIAKEKKIKVTIEKKGGRTLIVTDKGFKGMFLTENAFVLGSNDVIESLSEDKFKSGDLSGDFKKVFDEANFFAYFSPAAGLKDDILKKIGAGTPPIALILLKSLRSITMFDKYPSVLLKADFNEKTAAEDLKKLVESFKGMAEIMISSREKEEDAKISKAGALELLNPELIGMKTAIAAGKILLSSIVTTVDGSAAEIKFSVPDDFRDVLKPEHLPVIAGVTGVLAAIAIPNFVHARDKAQKSGCIANMRTIEGACELYQMENKAPASLTTEDLVKKEYLKRMPECASQKKGSKLYKIMINNSGFDVECPIHGKLSELHK